MGKTGLDIHYTVINDWEPGIDAAGNMIVISIPTVLDPSLAPDGKHVVHAYTAGALPARPRPPSTPPPVRLL